MRTKSILALLACVLFSACEEKDEARLSIGAFGPEETGYPFATAHGAARDLRTLHVKGTDQDGAEAFAFDAGPGSTLIYRLPRGDSEAPNELMARTRAFAATLTKRLRAAGLVDTTVGAEQGGVIRLSIPEGSTDGGADIGPLVAGDGTVTVRAVLGSSEAAGGSGSEGDFRKLKKVAVETWRSAERDGRPHAGDASGRLAVLDSGQDGSQPYHFQLVEDTDAARVLDGQLFDKRLVVDVDTAEPQLRLTWKRGARKRFDAWRSTQGERSLLLLLDGEAYAEVESEHITDQALQLPVRTWPCRPPQAWARRLARSLIGPSLPGGARFLARVNHMHGAKGRYYVFAPMAREGSLTIEVSAPGDGAVEPVSLQRRHELGHFTRYYFITMSYLGARHCASLPVELMTWKKYQEVPLLSFNVGITLSHHGSPPISMMAADMLADWSGGKGEPIRRIEMGLARDEACTRWASARCVPIRTRVGLLEADKAVALLTPLLEDQHERVRVATALGIEELGSPTDATAAVLTEAKKSKDPWVRYALRTER